MKTIKTKRLILRPFELNDVEDLYEFASDLEVALDAGWKPHNSLSQSADVILNYLSSPNEWAIVKEDKVIGSISLSADLYEKEKMMISFLIHKEYWNKGYGFESISAIIEYAFKDLQLNEIYAYHFKNNEKSCRLIQKLQFIYLKSIKDGFQLYNSSYLDLERYVLFQS